MNCLLSVLILLMPTYDDSVSLVVGGKSENPAVTSPFGLAESPSGEVVFVEMTGHRVRMIDAKGHLTTIAGTGKEGFSGDDGPAANARFNGMHALAISGNGDVLIADTWNNRVRKIDAKSGRITTIAGAGTKGFSGDGGPATRAEFGGIYSIALTSDGSTMFLADLDNRRIRAVDLKTGIVKTVAGNGRKGVPQDGSIATESPLVDPRAVAVDGSGNLYILERGGHALRVVEANGKIKTIVGTGKAGATGDDGPGLAATLNGPKDLTIDHDGSVLIADTENHMIRRYRPSDGRIIRVAGTGKKGLKGIGGGPLDLELSQPHGIFVAKDGAILISDSSNNRVLKIGRK